MECKAFDDDALVLAKFARARGDDQGLALLLGAVPGNEA